MIYTVYVIAVKNSEHTQTINTALLGFLLMFHKLPMISSLCASAYTEYGIFYPRVIIRASDI